MIRASWKGMRSALEEAGWRVWESGQKDGRQWMNGHRSDLQIRATEFPDGWVVTLFAGQGRATMESQTLADLIADLTFNLAAAGALAPLPRELVGEP